MSIVAQECPMCKQLHFMEVTQTQKREINNYIVYGGSIQERCSSLNKFGREFIKTGYCPACQELIFAAKLEDKTKFFYYDQNKMYEFCSAAKDMTKDQVIESSAFAALTRQEKLMYLYEMAMEDTYDIDSDGNLVKLLE